MVMVTGVVMMRYRGGDGDGDSEALYENLTFAIAVWNGVRLTLV